MKITRREFNTQLQDKKVSLEKLGRDRSLSSAAKRRLVRADLNHDGFVSGSKETSRLFKEMDKFDRNGDRNSIQTNSSREILSIHRAVMGATENTSSRISPRGSSSRELGQLLADNPSVHTNQDLLNLFVRRNHNNWNAASTEAKRYGVDINKLAANRNGQAGDGSTVSSSSRSTGTTGTSHTRGSGQIGRVKGMQNTSRAFRQKVSEIADRLGMNPTHLMAVMSFETGETFSPSQRSHSGSGATGLIQFMPKTARRLGTSTSRLARMSAMDQLDYVEKYLEPYAGKMKTVEDAYMAILWPAAVGKGSNYTLFRNSGSRRSKTRYKQNKGLDTNSNGVITTREAASKVRSKIL